MRKATHAHMTWLVLGVLLVARFAGAATITPEETVKRYLQAVKDAKFDAAYDLISQAMRGGQGHTPSAPATRWQGPKTA